MVDKIKFLCILIIYGALFSISDKKIWTGGELIEFLVYLIVEGMLSLRSMQQLKNKIFKPSERDFKECYYNYLMKMCSWYVTQLIIITTPFQV